MRLGTVASVLALASCRLAAAEGAAQTADIPKAFAARVALDAIAVVNSTEATILHEEKAALSSGQQSAMEVVESLDDYLRPHLQACILGLRHALVSGVITKEADLAEVAFLDAQLSSMLAAQAEEPLFFWHGPRRMVLPRLRRLLGTAKAELESLAAGRPNITSADDLQLLLAHSTAQPEVTGMVAHSEEALEAAKVAGLAVVASVGPGAGAYLEAIAGADPADQKAVQLRGLLRELGSRSDPSGDTAGGAGANLSVVVQRLRGLSLSNEKLQLLDTLTAFARPEEPGKDADDKVEDGKGLRQALRAALRKAAEALAKAPPASSGPGEPGVNPKVMSTLEEQAKQYKENNHVIYIRDFFDEATYTAIKKETQRLWVSDDIEGNCNLDGRDRIGGYVLDHQSHDSSLYKLIYGNEPFRRWATAVNGEGTLWPSDFPIELREYGINSRGMMCHPDLQMYAVDRKDLEFVVTVDNDSKCNISFFDAKDVRHVIHTTKNSVMMVRPNAAVHCVSPTLGGSRTILKFIYVGDYRKSDDFPEYKTNECGPDNQNNVALRQRREAGGVHAAEL